MADLKKIDSEIYSLNAFIRRVPSEHRNKPKFIETLTTLINPFLRTIDISAQLPHEFDLDYAVGNQLDVVGEWIGRSRYLDVPIEGYYFAFDEDESVGWDRGNWLGDYDKTTGLIKLSDDTYRLFLKIQIIGNQWKGTSEELYSIWHTLFDDMDIVLEDNQDMTISIGIPKKVLSSEQKAIFLQNIIPFKPVGVRIDYYFLSTLNGSKMFAFDVESDTLAGWDESSWAEQMKPIEKTVNQ